MLLDVLAQNTALDALYGPGRAAGTPASFEVALFAGHPAAGGVEVPALTASEENGYARALLDNDSWPAADGGVKSVSVAFETWDAWPVTVTHWALVDPVGGAVWNVQRLTKPLDVTGSGTGPTVALSIFFNND